IRDDLVTGVQTCALPIFWPRSSFTRSMTHPLAERQNGRFHARTACPRERARVKGKGRNGRGQGASEWIPPCGKAKEKQLPPGREIGRASCREGGWKEGEG